MQLSIPRRLLAAVSRLAAAQDVRYYLNGVLIEVTGTEARIVATNGAAVGVARFPASEPTTWSGIIPNDAVAHAIKSKSEDVALIVDDGGRHFLAGLSFTPVEGRFPEYRRIIPRVVSGETADFSADLIGVFAKVRKDLKGRGQPIIRQNGTGGAVVHFHNEPDFMGVLMPMQMFNDKNPDPGVPCWAAY